ncbi:hypothetical protein MWM44_15210, partial [Legionella pneumophila]|nr:hypothetical protein [Legionella pneumophila]
MKSVIFFNNEYPGFNNKTITALAVPVTAPYIAFASAGLSLGVGTFLLGKTLYERYQLGRERRKLKAE